MSATFNYKGKTATGAPRKGQVEATDVGQARLKLKKMGIIVFELNEKQSLSFFGMGKKVKMGLKDKIVLTEQLAVMVKSGLSVSKALQAMVSDTFSPKIQRMLTDIASQVEGGATLSSALKQYYSTFGSIFIQMIAAGEKSGKLDEILQRLSNQMQKDYDIRAKIRSALMYPVIIICLMVVVVIVIIVFVIPRLASVFAQANVELPLPTKILIKISDIAVHYGLWIVLGLVLLFGLFRLLMRNQRAALIWDRMKIRLPVYGPFVKRVYMARFSLTFASLLSSGMPILTIFRTSRDVVDNLAYQLEIEQIAKKIENGVTIATALHDSPYFPNMVAQLASIGEKSGSLEEVMWVISSFYEKEVDSVTRNLSTSLEPIIMVVLGVGVAFILISVLQPMYGLVNAM